MEEKKMDIMNKWAVLALVCLLSLFTTFSQLVSAEEPITSEGTSKATIEFIPGDGVPPIVDPEDPSKPFDPDNPENPTDPPTGNTGPLTLDYVSSVHFGKQEIQGQTMIYESTLLRPFIQISDRRGTGAGWTVTAQASEFKTDGVTEATLPGSVLYFKNGVADSACNSEPPIPNQIVKLPAGGEEAVVITAQENTGLGTWVNRWFPSLNRENMELNDNVVLEIPGGTATTGVHEATITWTLTDGPGQ